MQHSRPLSYFAQTEFLFCWVFLFCVSLPLAAFADTIDRLDDWQHFFQRSGPSKLIQSDGAVIFAKTGSGDAFVRWSINAPAAMPLTDENDRVELDLSGFADGGAVQLMVMIDDANSPPGRPKDVVWQERVTTVGRHTLPSVRALAKAHGLSDPVAYHLFFRIAHDPAGSVEIARIRLASEGDASSVHDAVTDEIPGTTEAELVFTADPQPFGISFDRTGAKATQVVVDQQVGPAWVVEEPRSGLGKPWQRGFALNVTDPGMVDGRRPVIDIELTYRLDAWGGIHVVVDTQNGVREVANLWGNCEGRWKTATIRVDDAALADGIAGGSDILLLGDNGPLWIKRVRVVAYDPHKDIQWERMLKLEATEPIAPTETSLFVFNLGDPIGISYALRNLAKIMPSARFAVRLLDVSGNQVRQQSDSLELTAGEKTTFKVTFDTEGLPLGPYTADLSIYLDGQPRPVYRNQTLLGLIDEETLGKALPGRFKFGLDPGHDTTNDKSLAWYRLMGVDLLRHPGTNSGSTDLGPLERAVSRLEAEGVETCLIIDPPGQIRPITEAQRVEQLKEKVAGIEKLASAMRSRITWYELGNEPDLVFFHPGPVAAYLDSFHQMADAVKRGNPEAIVMNGGLCFFGPEGDRRAREIIAGIDINRLDAWAYHGHGPGVQKERDAWQRQIDAVTAAGKNVRPLLDTETGVSASSPAGYREQSRTGVEKTIFAMSKGMASLMYFRLNMPGDEGYTLTEDHVQPRPTVLSYRAMVQRLRNARFVTELDAGIEGVEAYLFEEFEFGGERTGRKTLVAWNNNSGEQTVSVAMDSLGAEVRDPTVYDLYGNPRPAATVGVVATLGVGIDPMYLTWRSPGTAADVGTAAPALSPAQIEPFLVNGDNQAAWMVRNDTDQTLEATLSIETFGGIPMSVGGTPRTLNIAPHGRERVVLPVRTGGQPTLAAPRWWRVFTGLDPAAVDRMSASDFAEIPDSLAGTQGPADPWQVWTTTGGIDLAPLAGGVIEKTPALLFASIDAPFRHTLAFGASSDYWMRWYVNGRMVFDNFESGNRGGIVDHTFELPLEPGRNVIAAHVRSGTAGFRIDFGGPAALAQAKAGGLAPDRLEASLTAGDRLLAKQVTPITYVAPLPVFADLPTDAPLSRWLIHEPLQAEGEAAVENFHQAQPDSSVWYGGETDLSAVAWVRRPADRPGLLELILAVRDDEAASCPSPDAGVPEMLKYDAMQVTAQDSEGNPLGTAVLGMTRSGTLSDLPTGWGAASTELFAEPNTADGFRWLYRLRIPADLTTLDRLHVEVFDTDRGTAKQILTFRPIRIPKP